MQIFNITLQISRIFIKLFLYEELNYLVCALLVQIKQDYFE